ncbi:MAG TPA: amino acid ABC transporter permease [Dongiaceae bacterium]|nr:amino acid ABC transporter permease [Dongiaceae bacterium]
MATEVQGRASTPAESPAWWRDERKRGFVAQILTIAIVVLAFWFLISNMLENQARLGVPLSLDFLYGTAGFQISFSLIPISLDSPIIRIIETGIINTLVASAISIVLATLIGFLIGVLRLSSNWLIARLATVYIEVVRNIPLLVQLLFWYAGITKALPVVRQSIMIGPDIALNVRGLFIPRPVPGDGSWIILVALIVAIVGAVGIHRWSKQRQKATGRQFPSIWTGVALIVLLPIVANFAAGSPVTWEIPKLQGFNFRGGLTMAPELVALVMGLSVYTSAYIAEIVRGGIIAISHGQTEAALALGLKPSWNLRLVVIPQALRVITPPLTSQYLNVLKNSTLAGATGFPDLYAVIGTSQNQTGRAVECVAILMLFYLIVSLLISLFMNWYNKRLALVER